MNELNKSALNYHFTNNWFTPHKVVWSELLGKFDPTKILEVGSYEGASSCFLVEKLACEKEIELHCIDSWTGGIEHQSGGMAEADMSVVELRFKHNIKLAKQSVTHSVNLQVHKKNSDVALSNLLASGHINTFDLVYIDGSHQAPDVLCDAVLGFRLLRSGGLMIFDDYFWQENLPEGVDLLRCPKPAIDSFTNLYCRKLNILGASAHQLFVQKNLTCST